MSNKLYNVTLKVRRGEKEDEIETFVYASKKRDALLYALYTQCYEINHLEWKKENEFKFSVNDELGLVTYTTLLVVNIPKNDVEVLDRYLDTFTVNYQDLLNAGNFKKVFPELVSEFTAIVKSKA